MVNIHPFVSLLENANIPDSVFEIRCMCRQLTGTIFPETLTPAQEKQLLFWIQERISGMPLQYLLGEWEFYGIPVVVGEGVLIPRPETELLIDEIRNHFPEKATLKIFDLCTGSGCIALALKKFFPKAEISAVDISPQAISYAKENFSRNHAEIDLFQADVLEENFSNQFQNYDLLVCNPPYLTSEEMNDLQPEVKHEPENALFAPENGLFFYRKITSLWKKVLHSGGMLFYEIGWKQGKAVAEILEENAFSEIQILQDIEQRDRIVMGMK